MNRRRRYSPDWSQRLPRSRRRMGRLMLLLGLAILGTALVSAQLARRAEAPVVTPTVTSPTGAPGTQAATPVDLPQPGSVTSLELQADGWYLALPHAWPFADVDRVIDGDTLEVSVGGIALRVRAFGLDAPERDERCGAEATARMAELAGRQVRLVADVRQRDPDNRGLRYLFTPSGRSIDAALIDEGLARAWREDGGLRDLLVAIETEARAARRGCLWAN